MKMEKTKHNHSLTDCLKVGIYAMIMLAPVTAILSTTSYMALNKNAELPTQSTTNIVEISPQTNVVNTMEDLVNGNWYQINYNSNFRIEYVAQYVISEFDIVTYKEEKSFGITLNSNNLSGPQDYYLFKYVDYSMITNGLPSEVDEFYMQYIPKTYETQYIEIQENANAFYYACNQVIEQPLFNWTQSTGTYQVFESVTNGLGMQDQTLPTILTYMFLVTIIYLIIDIIIEVIKLLTHLITSK